MIGITVHGNGFRGVLEYNLQPQKGRLIGHENMLGETPRELAHEFGVIRRHNTRVENPVFHTSLSLGPGERLSDEQWVKLGRQYLHEMGFTDNQAVFIRHHDTGHDHLHLVANRVRITDTKVVNDWREKVRSQNVIRGIEQKYDLIRVQSAHEQPNHQKALALSEIKMMERTREPSRKIQLQTILDAAKQDHPDMTTFVQRLEAYGVGVQANIASTGKVSGLAFEYQDFKAKASKLGRAYSWAKLTRTVDYESSRDLETLRAATGRATDRANQLQPGPAPATEDGARRTSGGIDRGRVDTDRRDADQPDQRGLDNHRDQPQGSPAFGTDGHGDVRGSHQGGDASAGSNGPGTAGPPTVDAPIQAAGDPDHHPYDTALDRLIWLAGLAQSPESRALAMGDRRPGRVNNPFFDEYSGPGTAEIYVPPSRSGVAGSRTDRTSLAVERQLSALPASTYEIAVSRTAAGKAQMIRRQRSRHEIRTALPWLKRENALGADITMRPMDGRFVLVHDLDRDGIDQFKKANLPPSAVLETEPGRFQAWIRLTDAPVDPELSEQIARRLADAASKGSYPSNLGRLAGFTNRAAHLQRGSHYPYVLIHDHQPLTAPNGQKLLDGLRAKTEKQIDPADHEARGTASPKPAPPQDKTKIAMEQQFDALPSERYVIAVKYPGSDHPMLKHQGTRAEILESLGWIKEQHAKGGEITMRPLDSRFVVIHNLNQTELAEITKLGLPASVILETEPGKYQSWIKLTDEPIEPELNRWITERFADSLGGPDPVNLGRLAGFGDVQIHDCQPQTAPRGPALIEIQRKNWANSIAGTVDSDKQTASRPPTKGQPDRTQTAVIHQLNALPAETYEIGVRRKAYGQTQMIRHQWRRSKIMASMSWLKHENAAGADIFIRPIDSRYILIHDTNPEKIDEFKQAGLPPSATLETEPGKYQAWVKLTDDPIEPELSEWIAKEIAKYGSNKPGHYPSNLGRLAGFTNHDTPTQPGIPDPYVQIHDHHPQTAPKGNLAVAAQRSKMTKAMAQTGTDPSKSRSFSLGRNPPQQHPADQKLKSLPLGFDPESLTRAAVKFTGTIPPMKPHNEEEKEEENRRPTSRGMGR